MVINSDSNESVREKSINTNETSAWKTRTLKFFWKCFVSQMLCIEYVLWRNMVLFNFHLIFRLKVEKRKWKQQFPQQIPQCSRIYNSWIFHAVWCNPSRNYIRSPQMQRKIFFILCYEVSTTTIDRFRDFFLLSVKFSFLCFLALDLTYTITWVNSDQTYHCG